MSDEGALTAESAAEKMGRLSSRILELAKIAGVKVGIRIEPAVKRRATRVGQ